MQERNNINIPSVLVPKTGTRTSSFWVLIAAWVVGGLFTGLFSALESKGYLDNDGSSAVRGWLVGVVAEILPAVYLAVSSWVTKKYIEQRGRVAVAKAEALSRVIEAQVPPAAAAPTQTTSATTKESS